MISFSSAAVSNFLSPKQVVMGDGASEKIEELLGNRQIPKGNVLFVADREVSKLGLVKKMEKPLQYAEYEVSSFDNIVGEPSLETAVELVTMARRKTYQAVVGVGGGSAMDMAKLAAALAVNSGDVTDYLGIASFEISPVPLILVPTTAGTGAEATSVSMFSMQGRKVIVLSPQLVPLAAILDPQLTLTMPPKVTAATGVDALSHALEGFMSVKASAYTDTQAITSMSIIARWLKTAYKEGSNIEARRAMSYAAFTGGLSLNAGVVLGHSVAYTIANRSHVPHGVSCAMALPYTIVFNKQAISERISQASLHILGRQEAGPGELALWVRDLNADLGLPQSLKEVGLTKKDVPEMLEECISKYPRPTNPVNITEDKLKVFYEMLFAGDIEGYITASKGK